MDAPLSPLGAFLQLVFRPSAGLAAIRDRRFPLPSMVFFLCGVGFVRGLLDIPWIYWQAGKLPLLLPSLSEPSWYFVNVGPFVVSEIVTALLRWVLFATLLHGLCRFLGGEGRYGAALDFFGPLLGITLVTILLDYLYFFIDMPLIHFQVAPGYNPIIGVGQVATAIWIGWMTIRFARLEYGLEGASGIMAGAFIPLFNTGLFLIVMHVVMPLIPEDFSYRRLMLLFNVAFDVVGFAVFIVLLLWGRRYLRR